MLEVAPRRREERKRVKDGNRRQDAAYVLGRGSLHEKDEKERRQWQKEEGDPVIPTLNPDEARRIIASNRLIRSGSLGLISCSKTKAQHEACLGDPMGSGLSEDGRTNPW